MTKSEYQGLVEFVALRFDRVDEHLNAMDERLHRAEILGEDTRHQVRIVAEGVATVDRKLEYFRAGVADSFRGLDVRLTRVEGHMDHRGAH